MSGTPDIPVDVELLRRQIDTAESTLINQRSSPDNDDDFAVLFTGNWHDSFPRPLVLDQTLRPTEKITWQAIRLTINAPTKPGATPRRDELATMINCSPPTVTASRSMLRLTRWMTFCRQVRNQGRFVGDIFLLHDEPLCINTTLAIDKTFIPFLEGQAKQIKNRRAHAIAVLTLEQIDGLENTNVPSVIESMAVRTSLFGFGGYKGFSNAQNNQSKILSVAPSIVSGASKHHSKNFDAEQNATDKSNIHTKKILSVAAFCSFCNKLPCHCISNSDPTTTKTFDVLDTQRGLKNFSANEDFDVEMRGLIALHLPEISCDVISKYVDILFRSRISQIPVIDRCLQSLSSTGRQAILYQFVGRRASEYHGWIHAPLVNAIGYVRELVKRYQANQFFEDDWAIGIKSAVESNTAPLFRTSPEKMLERHSPNPSDSSIEQELIDCAAVRTARNNNEVTKASNKKLTDGELENSVRRLERNWLKKR